MKKISFILGTLSLALLFGIMSFSTSAYQGNGNSTTRNPNFSQERYTEISEAIESGDYETWKELVSENGRNPQILEVVTADNFDRIQEIHKLREENRANLARIQEIHTELGLERMGRGGQNKGQGKRGGRRFNPITQ